MSSYCFTGLIIILMYLVKQLFVHTGLIFTAQDYILILFFSAVDVGALGSLTWTIIYRNDVASLLNSLLQFNRHIG